LECKIYAICYTENQKNPVKITVRIDVINIVNTPDHRIHPKYHRRSYSQRRDSLGSDSSSVEDVEETYNRQRLHNRSKSAAVTLVGGVFPVVTYRNTL
jgi:hypothetical protein